MLGSIYRSSSRVLERLARLLEDHLSVGLLNIGAVGSSPLDRVLVDNPGLYLVFGRTQFLSLMFHLNQILTRFILSILLDKSLYLELARVEGSSLSLIALLIDCLLNNGGDLASHDAVNHLFF